MLKIGLTGGIGSGKSFVSNLFSKWGSYVFDADKNLKKYYLTMKQLKMKLSQNLELMS